MVFTRGEDAEVLDDDNEEEKKRDMFDATHEFTPTPSSPNLSPAKAEILKADGEAGYRSV